MVKYPGRPPEDDLMTWSSVEGVDPVGVLRSTPESILFLRPDLTIVDATDRYLAATMRTRDELVGRPLFEAFPGNPDVEGGDEGVAALRSSLELVLSTRVADTMPLQRYDIPRPDGDGFEQRYWLPANTPVLDDGEVVLILHQVSDVTEVVAVSSRLEHAEADRRELEERFSTMEREIVAGSLELHRANAALRASEERFRLMCDATSDALWDWDVASDRLWWSDGIERTFGYRPIDLSPLLDSWTTLIHPDDADAVAASLHEAMERGDDQWERQYRFRHRDGHTVWVHDYARIVRDASGRAYRLVGGMDDVTEQRRVEEQYARAQRMESVGLVAGGIAHDLNNVLSPVLMGAEMLAADECDPDRRQLLDVIVESARRGAKMVQQVLTFARGTRAGAASVRVADLIDETVRFLRETFPADVRIETSGTSGTERTVSGDPTRLHQVLLNLCVNGRDAMPQGGTLTISCDDRDIDESFVGMYEGAEPGRYVVITVADTGEGMSPDVLGRIWEPFFSTKGPDSGTGLGLPTCEMVVREHGGFIRVRSRPGSGSAFEVHLPMASVDHVEAAERPSPPRGDGYTVMLVDDEESILAISRSALEAHGYRVVTATSGVRAVATIATADEQIDAVLLDLMMPDLDGAATIRALAHMRPELVFVVVSGTDTARLAQEPVDVGARSVLTKPYTAHELLTALGDVLAPEARRSQPADRPRPEPVGSQGDTTRRRCR